MESLKPSWALLSGAFVITTAACSSEGIGVPSGSDDSPSDVATSHEQATPTSQGTRVVLDRAGMIADRSSIVSELRHGTLDIADKVALAEVAIGPADKLSGALRAELVQRQDADLVEAVIQVHNDAKYEPLPTIDESQPRDSVENQVRLEERRAAFARMAAPTQRALSNWGDKIRARGGQVLGEHLVSSALTVKLPVKALKELQGVPELSRLSQPSKDLATPPAVDNGVAGDNMSASRGRIKTDPYFNLGYTGSGFIGLIDTGVRTAHVLLGNPNHISLALDCVNGGTNCDNNFAAGYNPGDAVNHGTAAAAIITGTNFHGNNWRGISSSWVDSFKVGLDNFAGGTDLAAVDRAYARTIFWGDWVANANIQVNEPPNGPISNGANNLFDMGIGVIAANGNNAGFTKAPGNATKALGVGGYDVQTLATSPSPGSNNTPDNRFKPDFRMPTNVETASRFYAGGGFCDNCLQVFGGTSAAAPAATGTAAVLRHFLISNGLAYAPGNIYAGLIAFGDAPINSTNGAGKVALGSPTCSVWWSGSVDIAQGQIFDISFSPATGETDLRAGIWWPENYQAHRDIDIVALRPDGSTADSSTSGLSVFERVAVNGPIVAGNWNVRISGYSVPFGTQKVYYVMYTKRPC